MRVPRPLREPPSSLVPLPHAAHARSHRLTPLFALGPCRQLYQVKIEGFYVVKQFLVRRPLVFLTTLTVISLFTCTHWMHILERTSNKSLSTNWACLWLILTTMTKIGYGDATPVTLVGRMVIVISAGFAIFIIISSMVAVFYFIKPTNRQLLVIRTIERIQKRTYLAKVGAATIQVSTTRRLTHKHIRTHTRALTHQHAYMSTP